jgi:glycosyltransferase involved in cell wall biosynthesis
MTTKDKPPRSLDSLGTICVASSGLGHVARGIEAWANDLGHALADRGAGVILCKGGGDCQASYERVVPCWTRESAAARRVLARMPRFLGWRLGVGNGYGIEQTTFAWNLLSVLRRARVSILHVQDPQVAVLVQRARALGLVKARTILAHGTEESVEFLRRITYLQHLAPWHLEETRGSGAWQPTWTAIPNFVDTERFAPGVRSQESGVGSRKSGVRSQQTGNRGQGTEDSGCPPLTTHHSPLTPHSPLTLRQELGIPETAVVVLCAAAIKRHHKRVDYLLSEFADLRTRRPELPLWLVVAGGWESETDELVAQGQRLLGERVRFLVRFPRERMAELYRAADIFVLASLKEMMPIALLEATASGLPCVVNAHPVMQWMVGPGGCSVDLSAPGKLAQELERLAGDSRLRSELGRLAREHCVANFGRGREAVVKQILDYYARVLEIDNRPALAD